MNLAATQFPGLWLGIAAMVALGLLGRAVWAAPWLTLRSPGRLHAWLGSMVALMVVWSMNAGVREGLNLHLLGAAVLTLMFGRELALVALAAILLASALNGGNDWHTLGLNLLVSGWVPVMLAHHLRRWVERLLPANYFVYVFVQAFAGSGLGVVLVGLTASLALAASGAYPVQLLLDEYLPFFLLLAFSEAWLSGMAMTLLVVFRPDWVASFDDKRYLIQRPRTGQGPDGRRDTTGEKRE